MHPRTVQAFKEFAILHRRENYLKFATASNNKNVDTLLILLPPLSLSNSIKKR